MGTIFALLTGISQPTTMMVAGRMNTVLLTVPHSDPRFRKEAFENIYIFLGFGIVCFAMNYLQVRFYSNKPVTHRWVDEQGEREVSEG